MTTSKFTFAAKAKLPAVCHAQLALAEPLAVDGAPPRLTAFATWTHPDPAYEIAESFPLSFDAEANEWSGASSDSGLNLQVTVHPLPTPNHYTFELELRIDQDAYDSVDWEDVDLVSLHPFDSGPLQSHYPPPYPWTELHVLA